MTTYDFFELLINNIGLYVVLLLSVLLIYYLVFRKICHSLLDPLFMGVMAAALGTSVVMLLYVTEQIYFKYFLSYCLTQVAFIIGIISNIHKKSLKGFDKDSVFDNEVYIKSIFYCSSIIFIIFNLIIYVKLGIPIFLKSRLDLTVDAGGWGILTRFTSVSGFIAFYLFLYYSFISKTTAVFKQFLYCYLVFHLLTLILSGAKSSFWTLVVIFFCFLIVNRKYYRVSNILLKIRKTEFTFIIVGLFFALLTIFITYGDDLRMILTILLQRFVGYGDIYWYAYPNAQIEDLSASSPFIAIFSSFLGFFRMVDQSQIPEPLGYSLNKMLYSLDSMVGPNPRHNIFAYVYFGPYLSILYSYCLGVCLGLIRSFCFNSCNKSVIFKFSIIFLYISVTSIDTAVDFFFLQINNLIVVLPVILVVSYLVYLLACFVKYPEVKKKFSI